MCNAEYINTCMFIEYSLLLNMYLCNIDNYKIYIEQVGKRIWYMIMKKWY